MTQGGLLLLVVGLVAAFWPPLLAWPLALLNVWLGTSLIYRAFRHKPSAEATSDQPIALASEPKGDRKT